MRNPSEGRAYYDRKRADGKGPMEAMRCVKRRLSDIVYQQMLNDALRQTGTGPGGHRGTTTDSSVTGSHPHAGSSEKSLPGTRHRPAYDPTPDSLLTQRGARSGGLLRADRRRYDAPVSG